MASRPLPLATGRKSPTPWRFAQWAAVAGMAALPAAMWVSHEATAVFWRGIVPLIPALLLVHPSIWRNVCPLATLSIGPDRPGPGRASFRGRGGGGGPGTSDTPPAFWPPALLLLLLIAVRPLGLDESGPASATLLVGLGTAAVLGRRKERKSGFCNRHCPVLAVERLYGQSPLIDVANARCDGCSTCVSRGCLDLSPAAASAQLMGPGRKGTGWLRTPLGIFAATFPGFILGFSTLPSDPSLVRVLAQLVGGGLASGLVSFISLRLSGMSWRVGFRVLGALSAALYLGFALPGVAEVWGWPAGATPIRIMGLSLVLGWLLLGSRRRPRLV